MKWIANEIASHGPGKRRAERIGRLTGGQSFRGWTSWLLVFGLTFVPNLLMAAHKGTALLSPQTYPSMSDYGPKSLPGN